MEYGARGVSRGRGAIGIALAVALLVSAACGRTIEDDEPRELAEHRIEPCRTWCSAAMSPECGNPQDITWQTVDECTEDCAAAEPGGWSWGLQEDGTDACAEEWYAVADCMALLTCEQQHYFFNTPPVLWATDHPCHEELAARQLCFNSTPSLDRPEDE